MVATALALSPLTPGSASASTSAATPYPMAHAVTGLSSGAQMVWAGGHLFVSSGRSGSDVVVLSADGSRVKDITGEPGAYGLVASPDGGTVFVALANSDAISAINTATLTETTRYTVDSCPANIAYSAGRVVYSFGCEQANENVGVSSIDPATPGAPVAISSGTAEVPPLVSGRGTNLAVAQNSSLLTYAIAGNGTATVEGSTTTQQQPNDMTFTPSGSNLLVAFGGAGQITSYATTTLNQTMSYPGVAYPTAVAVDPSGSHVAAGFESYDTTVSLYGASTGTTDWQRYTVGANPLYWQDGQSFDKLLEGTLTFSTDGTRLYGLVSRENTPGLFLFVSGLSPRPTKISVKAPNVAPGRKLTATSVVSGVPKARVSFLRTAAGAGTLVGSAVSTSRGVATKRFRSPSDGTITAAFLGSATQLPATATRKFSIGSVTRSRLVGAYKVRHGVTFFRSYKKVNVLFRTTPPEASRHVTVTLYRRRSGHWHKIQRLHGLENDNGGRVFLKSGAKHVELRVHIAAATDTISRSSSVTSKPFEIS
jgi:YVTN family beta-propeller protein